MGKTFVRPLHQPIAGRIFCYIRMAEVYNLVLSTWGCLQEDTVHFSWTAKDEILDFNKNVLNVFYSFFKCRFYFFFIEHSLSFNLQCICCFHSKWDMLLCFCACLRFRCSVSLTPLCSTNDSIVPGETL